MKVIQFAQIAYRTSIRVLLLKGEKGIKMGQLFKISTLLKKLKIECGSQDHILD